MDLVAAARRLVLRGYRSICATHLTLEMAAGARAGGVEVGENFDLARADWVGREMRACGMIAPGSPVTRRRPAAGGNALSVYEVDPAFVAEALTGATGGPAIDAMDWCLTDARGGCGECPYQDAGCELGGRRHHVVRRQM